jgi:hypothetical protein
LNALHTALSILLTSICLLTHVTAMCANTCHATVPCGRRLCKDQTRECPCAYTIYTCSHTIYTCAHTIYTCAHKNASACLMVHVIPEFAQYTSCFKPAQGACLFAHAVSKCANMYCRHTNLLSTCLLAFEYVIRQSSQYVFWIQ